jgi:cell division ATPase FtsA
MHGGWGQGRPDTFEAARLGPEGRLEGFQMSRAGLLEAFGPRLEQMLDQAGALLAPLSRFEGDKAWRCALTGGTSLMPGFKDVAQSILHRPTRSARPFGFGVLDDAPNAPAYAVAAGLLRFEAENLFESIAEAEPAAEPRQPFAPRFTPAISPKLGKAWDWFKENF